MHYASGGKEAAGWLRSNLVDAVVTDLQMPEMNGLEFVRHMKSEHPLIPVILMTGQGAKISLLRPWSAELPATFRSGCWGPIWSRPSSAC